MMVAAPSIPVHKTIPILIHKIHDSDSRFLRNAENCVSLQRTKLGKTLDELGVGHEVDTNNLPLFTLDLGSQLSQTGNGSFVISLSRWFGKARRWRRRCPTHSLRRGITPQPTPATSRQPASSLFHDVTPLFGKSGYSPALTVRDATND